MSSLPARERIIVAFDVQTNEDYNFLVENLNGIATYVKVGMEIFYAKGEGIIKELQEQGFKIFLDLKIHDIPNTMMNSVKALTRLGVDIINVHASAGLEGMNAARVGRNEGMQEYGIDKKPLLIAVTQLTSTNQETLETEIGIKKPMQEVVTQYAVLAKRAGLDGVVCSAKEAAHIKESCGVDFLTICPGIRPKGSHVHDQKRVVTPTEAIKNGADFLVVGRTITQNSIPGKIFEEIVEEIENA